MKSTRSLLAATACLLVTSVFFPDLAAPLRSAGDDKPTAPKADSKPAEKKADAKDSADKDYSSELPRIASKTPEESIKAAKVKPGFHLEVVASEPLIRSPMGMDFDEYGRAFVVELPEYNQYASPKSHGKGAIKLLEDTDGDGRYDKATVYVDELNYPTGVACWDGGIFVGAAPDLLYCKDTDGDGKADVRKKLFTGFGMDKAGEGMLNSFRWRIDNRFHIPCGLDGGDVENVNNEEFAVPAIKINVRGQHLLLDPRGSVVATSGGGQHGMSMDDWNRYAFVCGNSEPVHLLMYDGRYLARNPYLQAPAAAVNIAPEGKYTKLMRVSDVEPWRVLRTRLRSKGIIPGSDEGGTASGFFTGATGVTVYRGDAWPAEYRGNVFVGEVANNLVYRAKLERNGVGLTAHRADTDAEFLASADNWFRPVQFANAPDGNLYVIDMYRELIEGAAFLAPQILKHMDPSAGADKGRIYRIAPDGFAFKKAPRLGDFATVDLVPLLEHPNAWHRETASRLIYQRQDPATVAPLRELATKSKVPLARAMAMHALNGLRRIGSDVVVQGLKDEDPHVRVQALRISEGYLDYGEDPVPEIGEAVLALAKGEPLGNRYQAAFTLGAMEGTAATQALAGIAVRDGADPWFQLAVLSSIGNRRDAFLAALLAQKDARTQPHVKTMLNAVAGQIGASNVKSELAELVRQIDVLAADPSGKPLAEDLVRNLVARQPAAKDTLTGATGGQAGKILAGLLKEARELAVDDGKPEDQRAAAVRTLASGSFDDLKPVFADLLHPKQPSPVLAACIETLGRFESPEVPKLLLGVWSSQTPQFRVSAIETLLSRPAWVTAFLDAVEKKTIARSDVDPARVVLLQKHSDEAIRGRAVKLFAGLGLARRQEVVDGYQKVLELKGDVDKGRIHFRKTCAACHKLEGVGESIGADLNAIRDRGTAAVMLNILDPNREVKPQFLAYIIVLDTGRTVTGMISAENANSLTIRKADNTSETILRVNIDELRSTGLSFMPEGLEKQLDHAAMADLLAYLNSIK